MAFLFQKKTGRFSFIRCQIDKRPPASHPCTRSRRSCTRLCCIRRSPRSSSVADTTWPPCTEWSSRARRRSPRTKRSSGRTTGSSASSRIARAARTQARRDSWKVRHPRDNWRTRCSKVPSKLGRSNGSRSRLPLSRRKRRKFRSDTCTRRLRRGSTSPAYTLKNYTRPFTIFYSSIQCVCGCMRARVCVCTCVRDSTRVSFVRVWRYTDDNACTRWISALNLIWLDLN